MRKSLRGFLGWGVLLIAFLIAGEGLNLFRIHVEQFLAYGHLSDAFISILGLVLAFIMTAFLGGFVYYRDKKRGKLKREGWRGRPIVRQKPPRERKAVEESQ